MANVVLPQVSILNSLANDANLLVEQNGEINRFAVTDLDIGGGDVTVNLSGGSASSPIGINADSLGGYPAADYVRNAHRALTVDLNDVRDGVIALSNADMLGGVAASEYAKLNDLGITMELLWENASPDSAFATQELIINNCFAYDYLLIYIKNVGGKLLKTNVEECIRISDSGINTAYTLTNIYARDITLHKNYIGINNCLQFAIKSSGSVELTQAVNIRLVPLRIYGIKGVI